MILILCASAHAGNPILRGALGPLPWNGAQLTPGKMLLPHMYHHTKFRRSRSNSLGISVNCGGGLADPKNKPLSTCVILPHFVVLGQMVQYERYQ